MPCSSAGPVVAVLGVFQNEMSDRGRRRPICRGQQSAGQRRYMPGHPDADKDGYVSFPHINPAEDMVDLLSAARGYQRQRGGHGRGEGHDQPVHRPAEVTHGLPITPSPVRTRRSTADRRSQSRRLRPRRGRSSGPCSTESVQRYSRCNVNAQATVDRFLSGEGEELHHVAMAAQKAELSFDLFMQVRNKVVSAYQEIMRMQV